MNNPFKVKPVYSSIALAFALQSSVILAGGYYPALPPTLSTSVTPNVMLMIDNSGSMVQDQNNAWIPKTAKCDSDGEIWTGCIVNNTDSYRTVIDADANTKMIIAKDVAKTLVNNNPTLRWGVASFRVNDPKGIGGSERGQGAKIVTNIGSTTTTVTAGIDSLVGRTATPLGEALLEITQYYQGKASLNGLGSYTSPIQYRCQKNFTIVITDGDASNDETFPAINYTSINSSNVAVSKTFNVCTAASGTDCPATLEGASNTSPTFGNTSNYPRALRDVAKYANDLDMRVSTTAAPLNDLDGKSFDDDKFKKQNMQTYTVGFAVLNNVLPAAASVGGGKYYNANNKAELTAALTSAVNDIVASISNAGGVATQADVLTSGNKVFQPVFNPNGWYGELRCFNLDATGNFNPATSQCSPAKAIIPTSANRKIYTSKVVSNATTSFDFNASTVSLGLMTTAQLNALGTTPSDQTNVIDFIRGNTVTGFRTRSNGLLGDIIDSQPVVITKPAGSTTDSSYSVFQTSNANRNMVFIGANDGMLHAFSVATMSELMAYIPSPVYGNLKALTATDYGQSGGTPHEYHVNGSLRQADVKIGSNWKTILVGGLGQGGKGFFAVDATSESTLDSNSSIKWEWTDVSTNTMGYALGTPIIYNVRTSDSTVVPAVILSNGYENKWVKGAASQLANTSSLYIVNADTGALLKQIDVAGGVGLSSPAGVDAGQDGVLDYVYAGDINGKLWRFDLTDSSPSNFKVISPPIYDAGTSKPIVMRPAVMAVNSSSGEPIGSLVMFGTGKLLTDSDRSDTSQQTFYAVLDKMEDLFSTITESNLQKQEILTTQTQSGSSTIRAGTYRKLSSNSIDLQSDSNTKLGWFINLPVSSERLVTSPMIFEDKLLFGTGIPLATEKCLPGGKGWIMGVNPLTGSVTKNINKKTPQTYSFIDINFDNKSTAGDKISFSGGAEYMSGYEKDGIPTELTYVANETKLVTPTDASNTTGTPGNVIAQREANSMAVYTGNPKTTLVNGKKVPAIKIFKPIPRPASTGKGSLYTGTIGNDTVEKTGLLTKSIGVKVETTLWREIK
ncbi:pilus assembly protein [uncultured Deefgea sp.]|uniref:pilus assembly protein n=1 Tax=uncultured Deefgea sp. TaxID=1304914 RepID=UPI00262C53CD|nr:PilC/PilY family type IV pilus protein [uncultured Deefgea sp.]